MLARKRFWAGIVCVLVAAAWLHLGRGLELGTLALPGPGAFPLALALALLAYGGVELWRAAVSGAAEASPHAYLSRSPAALFAAAVAIAAAGFAFIGSLSADLAGFGPTASLAWHTLVLLLGALAAALTPEGSPRRVLGAVLLGLVLGTSGTDPLTPATVRFASVELGLVLLFVHGLLLALIARHIGLNGLVIALAMAVSAPIEKTLRQGSLALILDRWIVWALVAAGGAALAFLAWRRERRIAAASGRPAAAAAHEVPPLLERRSFWAGVIVTAGGAVGLYLGTDIGVRDAPPVRAFGPGTAPLVLSGALVVIGALTLALALWRPALADPPAAPLGSPATIGAIVFVVWLVVLLLVIPLVLFGLGQSLAGLMAPFGPPDLVALVVFIMTLCTAAACLMPRGTLLGALAAAVAGCLLGTIGLDPVTGVVRYAAVPEWEPVHGLALGFVAYRAGLNPPLIAIGFLYGPYLESNLFRTLILSEGGAALFVERGISLALLAASLAVVAVAAGLRWRTARRTPPVSSPTPAP